MESCHPVSGRPVETVGGTRSLTVDLSDVTHLASAGVSALHTVQVRSTNNGSDLHLIAKPGTPAQQILTLVKLHHRH